MESIYDWLTVAIFAGLIVLFLQRSSEDVPRDHIWQYLLAALGCAGADVLGNKGYPIPAIVLIVATVAYIALVLRPFEQGK